MEVEGDGRVQYVRRIDGACGSSPTPKSCLWDWAIIPIICQGVSVSRPYVWFKRFIAKSLNSPHSV